MDTLTQSPEININKSNEHNLREFQLSITSTEFVDSRSSALTHGTERGALQQPRGVGSAREGTYIHLWLIPLDVWQESIL